jgi:hypothetical protein
MSRLAAQPAHAADRLIEGLIVAGFCFCSVSVHGRRHCETRRLMRQSLGGNLSIHV